MVYLSKFVEVAYIISLRIGAERPFLRRMFSSGDSWSMAYAIERNKYIGYLSHKKLVSNYNR